MVSHSVQGRNYGWKNTFSIGTSHGGRSTVGRILALAALFICIGIQGLAQGTWVPIAAPAPHYNAGVMLLLTDGTVICKTSSGGGQGNRWDKLTPDASGSYVNGTWSTIAPMADDRLYFSSQVLRDGRVYVAGGEYGAGGDNGEVYDPLTNTWTACPSIITGLPGISDANSAILPDGKVLQAVVSSGTKLNYIWNPATNTYAPTGNCIRTDNEASWVKLPDNSIIFVDNYGTSAERYIPATGMWFNEGGAGTVPVSLYDPFGSEAGGAYLLPNGKVYFLGSRPTSAYYTPSGSPSVAGTWVAGPPIPGGLGAPDAASAMMVNGKILMALSPEPYASNHFPDSTVFYTFDYLTNTYTMVNAPGLGMDTIVAPCYFTNMLCLPDGTILYGSQGDDQYYEFTPATGPLAAGKPTINTIIENTCTSFTITGTNFNGISEGACYGDDWQNATNYPLVRLTSGTNVYYARTTNWNSTGVMRGSAPDTVQFTLPTGLPLGTYSLVVVVNGNPSAATTLTTGPANITPALTSVCEGANVTLAASITGGSWTTSNTLLATIGSSTGVVTGVGAGVVSVVYAMGTCTTTSSVTVNPSPAAITPAGPVNVCAGSSVNLTDATTGGVWSGGGSVATVTSGGMVTGSVAGTTTISYTLGGCSALAPITVNPVPANITGIRSVCNGLTTNLSDVTTGGTWSSTNTTVATIGSLTGVVTGASLGTSLISYTLLSTGCAATTAVTVNLSATPITGNTNICLGTTSALTDATPGGTWSSSNTAVATVGLSSGIVNSVSLGTASITYKLGSGCAAVSVVTVNPVAAPIAGVTSVCEGGVTSVTDAVTGGAWTSGNTAIFTVDPAGMLTGVAAGAANVTYTLPEGCFVTKPVTINAVPAAITGASTVCAGLTSTLTSATTGGTWSSTNTVVATMTGGLLTGVTAGTSVVIYTMPSGCNTSTLATVNTTPVAITGSPMMCVTLTTTLSDATPGGVWSSSNTTVATISGSGVVSGATTGTAIITYELITGCRTTTNVSVNPSPSAITGTTTFCSGSTTSLSNTVPGGVWSSGNTAIATTGSTSGIVSGIATGTAVITYSVGAGCEATVMVDVITGAAPITGSTATCPGSTTALSDITPGGTWSSTNSSVATVSGSGLVSGISTGTATISYLLVSGCSATAVVTVGATTAAPITGVSSLCAGATGIMSDATPGGVWSSSNTAKATVGSTSGLVSGIAAGTVTITYKVTNACGTATATQAVTVNPFPIVAPVTGVLKVCVAGTTTLSNATPAGVWTSGNTALATVSSTGVVSGVAAGSVPISYTVVNTAGCAYASIGVMAVNAPISAVITPASSTFFCSGAFVTLNATAGTGYTYQWQNGGVDIAGATAASYNANFTGNFGVIVNGPSICASSAPVVPVTVNPAPKVMPKVNVIASPGTLLCLVSSPVTFTQSSTNGGTAPAYTWYVNGSAAGTGTTYSYLPANGDVVKCVMNSNATCAFPDTGVGNVTMVISPAQTPLVSIAVAPADTVCTGKVTTYSAVPVYGGTAPSFAWTKNMVPVGSSSGSFTDIPLNGDIIRCTMTSNYLCLATTTAVSNPFRMSVIPPSTNAVVVQVTKTGIAVGQLDTFIAVAPHGGLSPVYQWYVNGTPAPGETAAMFITSALKDNDVVSVSVTSSDDCAAPHTASSKGVKVRVGIGVSIKEMANTTGGFTLQPNPNNGTFTINGTLRNTGDAQVAVTITGMLGQSIYKEVYNAANGVFSGQISLPNTLAKGMYLVQVTSGEQHAVFHMVIEK